MPSTSIIIETTTTGRQIKQAINALLKTNAIVMGYKIPHIKKFTFKEGKATTTNSSLLIFHGTEKRPSVGPKILDQILKSWSEASMKL